MKSREYTTRSAKEMQARARLFAKEITKNSGKRTGALVVALEGDLGSGKTTFAQGFAQGLGVRGKIVSPTFVILRAFNFRKITFRKLVHVDAYRLDNARELQIMGWRDILKDTKTVVLVEWADNVRGALPKNCARVVFEHVDKNTRKMTMRL